MTAATLTLRACRGAAGAARRAFTLLELIVVIVIIGIMVAIAVPSFAAMLASSEESMAEQLLRSALRGGRDAAVRSTGNADAAVAFLYEPGQGGGRLQMVPVTYAGTIKHPDPSSLPADLRERYQELEIFASDPAVAPVQLPKGWMVRAYARKDSIDAEWYDDAGSRYTDEGDYVFPETGFYDRAEADEGPKRQSFIVRFEAGTGVVRPASGRPVLVVSVRPSGENRPTESTRAWQRLDRSDNHARTIARILATPSAGASMGASLSPRQKWDLLGMPSSDVVLAKAVSQLALYDEQQLAADLGLRIDRTTGSLYQDPDGPTVQGPTLASGIDPADINDWIAGDTDLDGRIGSDDDRPAAKLYVIDRYTAAIKQVEVMP